MRKTLVTVALLLVFSCPALAGEIGIPGAPAPPTTNGIIHTGEPESLTQTVLDLLAALPSLF